VVEKWPKLLFSGRFIQGQKWIWTRNEIRWKLLRGLVDATGRHHSDDM